MEISTKSSTKFDVSLSVTESELNQLLNEMEDVFTLFASQGLVHHIPILIEFKNLLTLSINNNK